MAEEKVFALEDISKLDIEMTDTEPAATEPETAEAPEPAKADDDDKPTSFLDAFKKAAEGEEDAPAAKAEPEPAKEDAADDTASPSSKHFKACLPQYGLAAALIAVMMRRPSSPA
jgi:hypothetical protein